MDRYSTGGEIDDDFQSGSNGLVLKNKLGIIDQHEIGLVETQALDTAYRWSFDEYETTTQFSMQEIKRMHAMWLGSIYDFAGELRTVNISKAGTLFAPVEYLETSCRNFESLLLSLTPCEGVREGDLIERISVVHGELLLLHPFREGNGRLSRWLADLMSLQAGNGLLDWKFDENGLEGKETYFAALRQSFVGNFSPLQALVRGAMSTDPS